MGSCDPNTIYSTRKNHGTLHLSHVRLPPIFASIEYIFVLLDSMEYYRLSLGFHTKVGGSGKRQRKKKPESVLTERTNPENPSYVVTGVSRKHDYEIRNNVSTR